MWAHNNMMKRTTGEQERERLLHRHSDPVQQGPALQVVMATVPETHEPERQRCRDELPEHTVTRAAQRHVYVPETTNRLHHTLMLSIQTLPADSYSMVHTSLYKCVTTSVFRRNTVCKTATFLLRMTTDSWERFP